LLRRIGIVVTVGALAAGGIVVSTAVPAFAPPATGIVMTCTGPGSGHATFSPGISNNTPTQQQTIAGYQKTKGCSGVEAGTIVKGKATFDSLKTVANGSPPEQPTCSNLLTPSPAGTVTGVGGEVRLPGIKWKDSAGNTVGISTGQVYISSTGAVAQFKATINIHGGKFFASGFTTKAKVKINFTPSSGQTCPTLTDVGTSQAGNLKITRF
jgi:hypothetical protein